jgi:TetR/AcrR family transcriptional regulator, transcriptional repressor of bet genes
MPKVGMGPIRRAQICRAAAQVIAEQGFDRTTLREVAEVAGVSTGTINHYFDNKLDMLLQTLVVVSKGLQRRIRERTEAIPPGPERMREFIRANLGDTMDDVQGWKVWVAAWSEGARSEQVRDVITERRRLFHELIRSILLGMEGGSDIPPDELEEIASEIDAYMNGTGLHILTGETAIKPAGIEDSMVFLVQGRLREAQALAARGCAATSP